MIIYFDASCPGAYADGFITVVIIPAQPLLEAAGLAISPTELDIWSIVD